MSVTITEVRNLVQVIGSDQERLIIRSPGLKGDTIYAGNIDGGKADEDFFVNVIDGGGA